MIYYNLKGVMRRTIARYPEQNRAALQVILDTAGELNELFRNRFKFILVSGLETKIGIWNCFYVHDLFRLIMIN